LGAEVTATSASSWWILVPVGVAVCGWAYAVSRQTTTPQVLAEEADWKKALYVVFLHKGYFDECYEVYFVQPTLRFANWLWRIVDIRGFDRAVHSVASSSIVLANWLWRVIDIKGIDRVVVGLGGSSVGFGRWLWRVVDVRWLGYNIGQILKGADAAGQILQETEPRTIQHHLLVMVFWLVLAIGLLYFLV
jgi:NADH:ubiquinone oxidoreductase subunit 5 (subunit L)/multisubunit Na+/H+ antiporter MnhA subunit